MRSEQGRRKNIVVEFLDRDLRVKRRQTEDAQDVSRGECLLLRYVERNCHANCVMNRVALEELAGTPLVFVAGSLGLCDPGPVWFEWGGMGSVVHHTVRQFRKCSVTGMTSVHFWFESEDGRVWDVLDPYFTDIVAPAHGKRISNTGAFWAQGCLVPGVPRGALRSHGLEYVPASPLVRDVLLRIMGERMMLTASR